MLELQVRLKHGNAEHMPPQTAEELYHAPISAADRALCTTFADHRPDTTCHGCVWYQDRGLNSTPCPTPYKL